MKTAVLFEHATVNGGEQSMLAALTPLRERPEWEFLAIAPPRGRLANALHALGIRIVPFVVQDDRTGRRKDRSVLLGELVTIVNSIRPDVLHANSLAMSRLTGALSRSFPPTPQSVTCFTGHLRDIMRLSRGTVNDLSGNSGLVAVSKAVRIHHVEQGLDPQRVVVIPNGVDADLFSPGQKSAFREELLPAIPGTAAVLLSVGQICLRKGLNVTAQAVTQLIGEGWNLHLVLAGQRFSAKAETVRVESSMQEEFDAAGCPERLHRLGWRDDIPRLMRAADVLTHAARQEPFGRVLLEAAASALPIIATDVGGTREMLRPDVDALLVAPDNVDSLKAAIREVLSDPQATGRRTRSARDRVESEFPVAASAERLAAFWEAVLSASNGTGPADV